MNHQGTRRTAGRPPAKIVQEVELTRSPGAMRIIRSALLPFLWLASPVASAQDTTARRDTGLVIEINVPAYRLDARLDTQVLRSFRVAVGMRRYPTPTGDYAITDIQWNPWWYPPDSPWASKDSVTPPGPGNPMGRVKMALGSALYVHGTPLPSSIGSAASHACIRMRNADAIALAKLVQVHGGAFVSEAAMDSVLRRRESTRRVTLPEPVPVRIVYRLVELRGDELLFHPDLYRRGRDSVEVDAVRLLSEAGYDTSTVDRELLSRVARDGARARNRVKVIRVLGLPPARPAPKRTP